MVKFVIEKEILGGLVIENKGQAHLTSKNIFKGVFPFA
jgi:hypothetical protein